MRIDVQWDYVRVAKCQGYGRYISVKILETWGKIFEGNKKMAKNSKNG